MRKVVLILLLFFGIIKGEDSFFQKTYKNSYLNELANLNVTNLLAIKSTEILDKKLYLPYLTKYKELNKENKKIYSNIFLSLYLSFINNTKINAEFKNFEEKKRYDTSLIRNIKIVKDTLDNLDKSKDFYEKNLNLVTTSLLSILKNIQGKKGYVYTFIRKTIGSVLLQIYTPKTPIHFYSYKFIKSQVSKLSSKNIKLLSNIFSVAFNALNTINTLSQNQDKYEKKLMLKQFLILKGAEFLLIIKSLNYNDYIYLDEFKVGFLNFIHNLSFSELDKQLQIDNYIQSVIIDSNFIFDTLNFVQTMYEFFKENPIGVIVSNGINIGKDYFDIKLKRRNYEYYRDLIYSLKYDSLYNYKFGYISSNDIRKHTATSLLLLNFLNSTEDYLYSLANTGADTYIDKTYINYYKNKKNLDDSKITNNTFQAIIDGSDLILKSVANGYVSIIKNLNNNDNFANTFSNYLNNINLDIDTFIVNFESSYNNIAFYLRYLVQMYSNKEYFDATFKNNINLDNEFDKYAKIYSFYVLNKKNVNAIFKSYLFNKIYNIPLVFQQHIENLPNKILRKDYFIMLLKAAGYNPYADSVFMKMLWKGKIKFFNDIDSNKLTFNEKIWLMYGKYLKIIYGDNNNLLPFQSINRVQAMAIAGRIYKQKFKSYTIPKCVLELLSSIYNLVDYDDLDTSAFKDFKKDVDIALYSGLIIGVPLKNSYKRALELQRNLTVYEGILIALRLNNLLNNNLVNEYTYQFYEKALNSNIFMNDKNLKNYTNSITNKILLKFSTIISLPNSLLKRNANIVLTYEELKKFFIKYLESKNFNINLLKKIPSECRLATRKDFIFLLQKVNYPINYYILPNMYFKKQSINKPLTIYDFVLNLYNLEKNNLLMLNFYEGLPNETN